MRALLSLSLISCLFLQGCGGETTVDGTDDDGTVWGNWLLDDQDVPRANTVYTDTPDGMWVINLYDVNRDVEFSTSFVIEESSFGDLDLYFSNGDVDTELANVIYSFAHPMMNTADIVFSDIYLSENFYLEGQMDLVADGILTHYEVRGEKVSDRVDPTHGNFSVSYDGVGQINDRYVTADIIQDNASFNPELSISINSHDFSQGDRVTIYFTDAAPLDVGIYDVEDLWNRGNISAFEVYSPVFGPVDVEYGTFEVTRSNRYRLSFSMDGETFDGTPIAVDASIQLPSYSLLK